MKTKIVDATVVSIHGRTGQQGECTKVMVEFVDPKTGRKTVKGRLVSGPIRLGDVIVLMDCEREVKII